MIKIELYSGSNCVACTRATKIIEEWRKDYGDRINVRYFSLDKSSYTYDVDKDILASKLGHQPDSIPVIFINDEEVKLSQLSKVIQDNI